MVLEECRYDEVMRKKAVRVLLVVVGTVSLALGVAGIFLPLLPTTPFLLLTSACYVRGSERMHRWLLESPWLGASIRNFELGNGIPLRAKRVTIAILWASISYSIYRLDLAILAVVLVAGATGVTVWIVRMPTLRLG